MEIEFITKLSVEECIKRLKLSAIKNTFLISRIYTIWNYDKKFFYKIDGNRIKIERVYYRNIHRPIFVGNLINNNSETKIKGHIETAKSAFIFEFVWFSFAGLFGVVVIANRIGNIIMSGKITTETLFACLFPVLFILFGLFVTKSMRIQANGWKEEMIEFMQKTFEAKIERK